MLQSLKQKSLKSRIPILLILGVAAIALIVATIGNIINSRILLISGLFSFNSQNMVGWHVFYITVACLVCYVVAIVAMIIGSFCKATK